MTMINAITIYLPKKHDLVPHPHSKTRLQQDLLIISFLFLIDIFHYAKNLSQSQDEPVVKNDTNVYLWLKSNILSIKKINFPS